MRHKIPLKTGIFDHSTFMKRVELWFSNLNLPLFISKHQFKYFPFFVNTLSSDFIISALTYSIQKRLPGLISDNQSGLPDLSHSLKQFYSSLNMGSMKKKDTQFYFLCIYLTKLSISFLEDTFLDLQIQSHLQSQIYIALVYVMIGLQVCPKSYELNHKKVIKKREVSIGKTYTVSKCDSIESSFGFVEKPSQKKIMNLSVPRKLLAKKTLERKGTQEVSRYEPSVIDQFKETLKENLAIQVLPKLPPKLIKAAEFDHITELTEAAKEGDQKRYLFTKRENDEIKAPSDFLRSTQNSSSFEMMMRNSNQELRSVHKTVKISHRPQLVSHKKSVLSSTANPLLNDSEAGECKEKNENNRKNWASVIKELKHHIKINAKHTMKYKWLETASDTPEVALENIQDDKEEKKLPEKSQVKPNEIADEKENKQAVKLTAKPRPHFAFWINQPQHHTARQASIECTATSQHFRKLKKQFDSQCDIREQQSSYSMFNLNSTFSFFRSLLH